MPPRRATRTAAAKVADGSPPPPGASTSRARRVVKAEPVSDAEANDPDAHDSPPEEDSEEETFRTKKPARKPAAKAAAKKAPAAPKTIKSAARSKAARALADEDEDEPATVEEQPESEVLPKKGAVRGKGKARAPRGRTVSAASSVGGATDTDDHDVNLDDVPSTFRTPRPKEKRAAPTQAELDEEEDIVLEQPTPRARPVPALFSPQKPTVEEDKGPKPRLVIHKIVLVNFKSYAGRQEIGPFHKVSF